jgi:hypothetical protein
MIADVPSSAHPPEEQWRQTGGEREANPGGIGVAPSDGRGGAFGDEAPRGDHGDAIRQVLGLVHVVRGEEDGLPQTAQTLHQIPCIAPCCGIETGRGLVEEEQVGIPDERQREVQPSSLAAGERPDPRSGLVGKTRQIDQLLDRTGLRIVGCLALNDFGDREQLLDPALLQHNAIRSRNREPPRADPFPARSGRHRDHGTQRIHRWSCRLRSVREAQDSPRRPEADPADRFGRAVRFP